MSVINTSEALFLLILIGLYVTALIDFNACQSDQDRSQVL